MSESEYLTAPYPRRELSPALLRLMAVLRIYVFASVAAVVATFALGPHH